MKHRQHRLLDRRWGFALPTVLIASVVMMIVLAVSVTSVASIRTVLKTQYYEQLAKIAGEAGVAYARACLSKNGNVPLWTDAKPLTPATDCAGNLLLDPTLDVLVVAGGGGGGGTIAGGGGGGGVVQQTITSVGTGSTTVTVGGGGLGGLGWDNSPNQGASGGNSSFGSVTATGGGGGGSHGRTPALAGGSGGGSTYSYTSGGAGTAGQGYAGGSHPSNSVDTAGGGGGGGGVGQNSTATQSGAGGPGKASSITGALAYYGGGGGGGSRTGVGSPGMGGAGGGGDGSSASTLAGSGTPNTGGGGGGAGHSTGTSSRVGGNGGSGIVVVRYPTGTLTATGGTITTVGLYKVHTFTSTGTFTISAVTPVSCPTNTRCSVAATDSYRSSFSVGQPTLDADGKALALPNTGYVELLRASTGAVWRTYRQPSVQAAVVPELCSGATTSALGWNNAVKTATQESLGGVPSASTISLADTNLNAGTVFYRKDFSVSESANYTVSAATTSAQDAFEIYIDGASVASGAGSQASATPSLSAGCHSMIVRVTNETAQPRASRFTAAVQKSGANTPVMVSDSSWRVSAGDTKHYSDVDYYASPQRWSMVVNQGVNGTWAAASTGDANARWIVSSSGYSGGNVPGGYTYYRDGRDVEVLQSTEVRISALCDDNCVVYLDGQPVINAVPWSNVIQQTITLTTGVHHFGIRGYNGASGPSGVALAVVKTADNASLTRTDGAWKATTFWEGSPGSYYSYSSSFVPSPNPIASLVAPSIQALIIGGGGGGGGTGSGGGAGGYIYQNALPITAGSYPVVIGAGSAGADGQGNAVQGSSSTFKGLTAIGGGGGKTHGQGVGASGGSGSGGTMLTGGGTPAGGSGLQGNNGGAGYVEGSWGGSAGGGGGAGGVGIYGGNSPGVGAGGPGLGNNITGTLAYYAAGGGAGEVNGSYVGVGGVGGGGSGAVNAGGSAGAVNTGSGGAGGSYNGSYFAGGAGGSGIVIIRYKTGALTATGGTVTTWGGYTIHTFTSNGTFVVTAVN